MIKGLSTKWYSNFIKLEMKIKWVILYEKLIEQLKSWGKLLLGSWDIMCNKQIKIGGVVIMEKPKNTDKYKHFNHYHELTDEHQMVDFGDGEFIANVSAIPILRALNDLGLRTRTHHVDVEGGFVSILIEPHISILVRNLNEQDRRKYDGMTELLIQWHTKKIN